MGNNIKRMVSMMREVCILTNLWYSKRNTSVEEQNISSLGYNCYKILSKPTLTSFFLRSTLKVPILYRVSANYDYNVDLLVTSTGLAVDNHGNCYLQVDLCGKFGSKDLDL